MSERVISERVVSTKVIKEDVPVISGIAKKFQNVGASIKGFFTAFVLLFIAFVVIIISEKFSRKSIIVESLPLEQATEVTANSDMHKIRGVPVVSSKIVAPENIGEVLYYDLKVEEYKEVEKIETETVTKTVDGQQVEETIEKTVLVDEWAEVSSQKGKWATFKLGAYSIYPESSSKKLDYKTNEYWLDLEWDEYELLPEGSTRTPQLNDQRMTINYLPTTSELVVVGEITEDGNNGKSFKSGEPFIITTKSDSQLISSMQATEQATFWIYKALAFFLLVAGLKGIIGPVLALLDFIPLVGKAADKVATVVAVIISVVTITVISFVIRYLWLFILIPAVVIGFLLFKQFNKPEKKDSATA